MGLVERVLAERPGISVLVTTGTVGAAQFLLPRLPKGALHQFVPVDLPGAVERFLDHWRPDLAIWVESELWPNLVLATHRRNIPAALVNARLSARSFARWRGVPSLVHPMLSRFALCLAQDATQAEWFRQLGAKHVACAGDLKVAAAPLPVDPAALAQLRAQIGRRPVWLAACTHPGEEEVVAAAHRRMAEKHPTLLTVIAPRHPVRGAPIAQALQNQGLSVARRSLGEPLTGSTAIYLADTLGELGLFYRLAGAAFIGGSLVDVGGHNPFEAARLDCAIVHGPDMRKNTAMATALAQAEASEIITDAGGLADTITRLLEQPKLRATRAAAAERAAAAGNAVLTAVLDQLAPLLDPLMIVRALQPVVDPAWTALPGAVALRAHARS